MATSSADPTRFGMSEKNSALVNSFSFPFLKALTWAKGCGPGEEVDINDMSDFVYARQSSLRIILAPRDLPAASGVEWVSVFNKYLSIPDEFVSERTQNVAHSFGNKETDDGSNCAWFHWLCKNINAQKNTETGDWEIHNPNHDPTLGTEMQANADYSWWRSGFFLKYKPRLQQNQSLGSQDTLVSVSDEQEHITLVCFGAPWEMEQRFRGLLASPAWEDILRDPYILFNIVLDELFLHMDHIAWDLSKVFGGMEVKTLSTAKYPGEAAAAINFVALHNTAKHTIYLIEGFNAILTTLDALRATHKHNHSDMKPSALISNTQAAFRHRKSLFQSSHLRLTSLEKRMQNLISLSFNLVTQQDSRILQVDSQLMKTIATMTLLFLPATTVATIFSSQFFVFGNGDGSGDGSASAGGSGGSGASHITVSGVFWLFWVIAVPLTAAVVGVGWWYYSKARRELIDQRQPMRTKKKRGTLFVESV
ncbi:hypothetical protein K402DRAFT_401202 [Aulographum hederae CBS 113979]|uniref:Cora-domain-containing protein n=1 Tax=Aulographum hederae CBS 113979 TaxID=1176131 RepID=A0A6G1HAV0_9PEZI|nr:hypothetical protein K402DRAFT_401202 [Aulographum hederae CBS 113979]